MEVKCFIVHSCILPYIKLSCGHLPFVVDMCLAHSPCPRRTADLAQPFQAKDLMSVFFSPSPNIPRHVRCTSALSLNPPPVALGPNHMVQLVECCKKGLALVIIWWIFLRKEVFYDDITTNRLDSNLHWCVCVYVCVPLCMHMCASCISCVMHAWGSQHTLKVTN